MRIMVMSYKKIVSNKIRESGNKQLAKSPDVSSFMVEYTGNIVEEFKGIDYADVLVITPFNAVVYV